ncbi:uncharacterized protein LOC143292324 [Babylonia areolata]|uniref:uncharacterized protein LOC143292324 n=1 Tax=Babylonia areolata TaxID=304850 RepID=UPI003FD59D6C
MGVYSSSFVVSPQDSNAVSSYSHPSKPNWITAHAISTELSIAEVERLWLRFQQMGCDSDGVLTPDVINSAALSSDVFMKNIMKYFKSRDGSISFESFMRALKWCETQELRDKARGIFQMLNNGNPIPKDLFGKIMSRVYPNDRPEEVKRVTESFFKTVDKRRKGQLEENDFVETVMALPYESVNSILNFHILPESMRENVHRSLPEFSNPQSNPGGYGGSGGGGFNRPVVVSAETTSGVIISPGVVPPDGGLGSSCNRDESGGIVQNTFKHFQMSLGIVENEEVKRVTESFFKTVDKRRKGQLEENDFVETVMALPYESVNSILNFHILPESMRENVHRSLPEFSNPQSNPGGYGGSGGGGGGGGYYSPAAARMSADRAADPGSQVPSDGILREIAEKVHRRDWDLLANALGFLSEDVDNYRMQYPSSGSQQVFEMLKDWRQREGRQAESHVLERALRDNGMTDASLLLAP